jgi:hypothetical protein
VKPRPRVRRGPDGWYIDRPRYGFNPPSEAGPYPSQLSAFRAALSTATVAGFASTVHDPPPLLTRTDRYAL